MKRFWDPENKYADAIITAYKHWVVEVSYHQHTPGAFIIFARRKVERISDLKEVELKELKQVMKKMEKALEKISELKPDRFNYLQLGNACHQLHFHVIPRYRTTRKIHGKPWKDKRYGHAPKFTYRKASKQRIQHLKKRIQEHLSA